tara:strand:- start:11532 stop:12527 length:996 start_codon:yes stop_codon:yes gene_type:complete
MKKDPIKEEEFYNKDYKFSYSSLNKLLFSPSLFYKDYILKEREEKTDKHLIEGKLLHLLLLQPEKLHEEFSIVPNKIPSDNVRRVLNQVKQTAHLNVVPDLEDHEPEIITALQHQNLYQSIKDDSKRLAKILTDDNKEYFKFLLESKGKDIIDNDMLAKAKERVDIIKDNKDVSSLLEVSVTDFEIDPVEAWNEKYLECDLKDYKFGLKGYVDRYVIDHESKEITIIDFKTTSKSLDKFAETVDYYNYWMQAVIYITLVIKNSIEDVSNYKITFNFVVIDNYDQVYIFDVSDNTLREWYDGFEATLKEANYHYEKKDYSLPYEFAKGNVVL